MTDGLKDAHREAIIAELAANERVERAVLFGSRATGTNTVSSDVDIALFGDRLTLTDQARLAAALDEIPMAQTIDLILYNSIRDRTLQEHIRNNGVEWFERPQRRRGWLFHPVFPKHWRSRVLHSMATWVNGLAFKRIQFSATGRPVIKIAEIKGGISGQTRFTQQTFDDSVFVRPGDLLFSWSGQPETSIDAFWWRGPEGWLNQHVFRVTPGEGLDTTFFYYLLRYLKPNFVGIARNKQTTGLGHVTKRDLENLEAAYPDLPEQRAIAHVLGTLDDKIELNRWMNETLEAMARALFKSWFVDFDPVRAKMEGRDTGLPQDIADLFPDRLVDSEMGEIPEGWCASTLADVALLNPASWSNRNAPDRILYVDLANTKWGYIDDIQIYMWADAPSRGRRVLRRGDTIVGTVRPGNGSFALIDRDGLTGSTGFAVLRPTNATEREIVWCAATSHDAIERLAHLADGGAYPAVRPKAVLDTVVVLPDTRVRLTFSSLAAPLLNRLQAYQREARTLAALRDTLLPKLMSGEILLAEAEKAMEAEA